MRATLLPAILGFSFLAGSLFAQSPVVADILQLSRAKVDEGVIVTYVQKAPRGNVSAADLLTLHSNGLSSRVLLALLDAHSTAAPAPVAAPADAPPAVPDQAPVQPAVPNVEASSPVVAVPVVNYVAAPVYVGPGSLYYYDDGWWGFGLGVGIGWGWGYAGWGYAGWGWNSCSPWYGYGWYPYGGYYYGDCDDDDNHHGNNGHNSQNTYGVQKPQGGGNQSRQVGRSTVASSAGNASRGTETSRTGRPASEAAPARQPMAADSAGRTASGNPSSRNAVNTLPGTRGVESPGSHTISRSSTYVANGRTPTAGAAPNTGARAGVAPTAGRPAASPGGVQVATTMARSQTAPARSAPSSYSSAGTAAPRYTGNPGTYSGYQTGSRAPASSVGAGGSYSTARSYSAPSSSMGNYSVGRSSGGAAGYSGGGAARGFSGGGGGARGGSGGGGGGRR